MLEVFVFASFVALAWNDPAGYPAVHTSFVYEVRDNPQNYGRLENYLYGPRDIPRRTQRIN